MEDQLQLFLTSGVKTNYPTGLNGRYKCTLHEIQYSDNHGLDDCIEILSNTLIVPFTNNNVSHRGILFGVSHVLAGSVVSLTNLNRIFYADINNYLDLNVVNAISGTTSVFTYMVLLFKIEKIE